MKRIASRLFAAVAAAILLTAVPAAHAQKIKVGYWTSGVSVGFGSVLEQMKFLEKQGLDVEFVKFADVNAPTRALASGAIDVAFGTSAAGALSIAADGVPVKIFLATQLAEVQFAVLENSPIKTLAEFKGKKIGMSPPGSATHALAVALLEGNYGLKPADYSVVPGNEPRLAQFLAQGEVQATRATIRMGRSTLVPNTATRMPQVRNRFCQRAFMRFKTLALTTWSRVATP